MVGVGVNVPVGVFEGVGVRVNVGVMVGVYVGVDVLVNVGVMVGVFVGDLVGVGVETPHCVELKLIVVEVGPHACPELNVNTIGSLDRAVVVEVYVDPPERSGTMTPPVLFVVSATLTLSPTW